MVSRSGAVSCQMGKQYRQNRYKMKTDWGHYMATFDTMCGPIGDIMSSDSIPDVTRVDKRCRAIGYTM